MPHLPSGLSPKRIPARSLIYASCFVRQRLRRRLKQFRVMAKEIPHTNAPQSVSHESIARRAYEIWQSEGCPNGRDMEHWLRALSELKTQSNRATSSPAQRAEENGTEPNKPRISRRSPPRVGEKRFDPDPAKPAKAQGADRASRGWA